MTLASVSCVAVLSISMALAAVLRKQVDQRAVVSGPILVLGRTIQPVSTELWLRSQP